MLAGIAINFLTINKKEQKTDTKQQPEPPFWQVPLASGTGEALVYKNNAR